MMDWLSDWLRNIIAVILLAVFVELLLPSKAMQRYARLVVGLFVLLTILTPLLKMIQGDFEQRLMNGFSSWSDGVSARELKMPTLEDIRREADDLSRQRAADAGNLTERVLERQIEALIEREADAEVLDVEAVLTGGEASEAGAAEAGAETGDAAVERIIVTLGALSRKASAEDRTEVQPVSVNVNVTPVEEVNASGGGSAQTDGHNGGEAKPDESAKAWTAVPPALSEQVRKLLQEAWGIDPALVAVRQPANESAKP